MSNCLPAAAAWFLASSIYAFGCASEPDEDFAWSPEGAPSGAADANAGATPDASAGRNGAGPPPLGGNTLPLPAPGGGLDAGAWGGGDVPAAPIVPDASAPDAAGVNGGPGAPPVIPPGGSCLEGITDYAKDGPFTFAARPSGVIKYFVPAVPAGCKVPVVHLANGTGATCASYQRVLNRLASHGFLAACYEDPNTGAGTQGLKALETAFTTFPDLVDNRIGSTGHSQGGQAAFTVLQLAEAKWGDAMIYAGLAMQPASGFGSQPSGGSWQSVYAKIKAPMFMFSGTADILVSERWVQQGFDALADTTEAYNWSAVGSTHIPTPQGPTAEVAIPWFRWKLLGDVKACEAFKKLPEGSSWDPRSVQNEAPCQ
jgi:predicted alpha/beta-hydrolase family hydrolase